MSNKRSLPSLRQEIFEYLLELRWGKLQRYLEEQYDEPEIERLAFEKRLVIALEKLVEERASRRIVKMTKVAGMSGELAEACFDEYLETPVRKQFNWLIDELRTCDWIQRDKPGNLIIVGPTGSGKTWLAAAFAHEAIVLGLNVQFHKTHQLLAKIQEWRLQNTYQTNIAKLLKVKLLILDDFLLRKLSENECNELYDIINERDRKRSTIVISQYPVAAWERQMAQGGSSNAMMDRLVHHSQCIELMESKSLRMESTHKII